MRTYPVANMQLLGAADTNWWARATHWRADPHQLNSNFSLWCEKHLLSLCRIGQHSQGLQRPLSSFIGLKGYARMHAARPPISLQPALDGAHAEVSHSHLRQMRRLLPVIADAPGTHLIDERVGVLCMASIFAVSGGGCTKVLTEGFCKSGRQHPTRRASQRTTTLQVTDGALCQATFPCTS